LKPLLLYPVGTSESCRYASSFLEKAGFSLTDHPCPEITHLLLDVPSKESEGLEGLLRMLPDSVTVIGGNLTQDSLKHYRTVDLLKEPYYLAANAAITAECALRFAAPYLKTTFAGSHALILGWGRIGKCLAQLLSACGCSVTVAARKESDRAMLKALGFGAVDFPEITGVLTHCRILFNTVPDLPPDNHFPDNWTKGIAIDLASHPGMQCSSVIPARGLPGKYAPESSGKLIAESILRLIKEEKQ